MGLLERDEIVDNLAVLGDRQSQLEYIISLAKEAAPLNDAERDDKFKVDGCLSQLWLVPSIEDGIVSFKVDSDAIIPKGIASVLARVYSGLTPQQILDNPPDFIKEAGIEEHLSINRRNGLANLIQQIRTYAVAYNALLNTKNS